MSGFSYRRQRGKLFEEDLFAQLGAMGFVVAVNGTEHTHPVFVQSLKKSIDQTSCSIRFQPDGVVRLGYPPKSMYIEAKAAKTIEYGPWLQYGQLCSHGNILAIVFEPFGWKWNFYEYIRLIDGEVTVSRYRPIDRFPVNKQWIYPRGSRRSNELAEDGYISGSFTPYREVEEQSLLTWDEFYVRTVEKLKPHLPRLDRPVFRTD